MRKERWDVICPFYKYDDGRSRITCEGVVDHSTILQQYQYPRDFKKQMEVFCCRQCEHCEVFRMVMAAKYEEA